MLIMQISEIAINLQKQNKTPKMEFIEHFVITLGTEKCKIIYYILL